MRKLQLSSFFLAETYVSAPIRHSIVLVSKNGAEIYAMPGGQDGIHDSVVTYHRWKEVPRGRHTGSDR